MSGKRTKLVSEFRLSASQIIFLIMS